MKRTRAVFLLSLLFISGSLHSQIQQSTLFEGAEHRPVKVPKRYAKSPDILAQKLTDGLTRDEQKIYVMCEWISLNIKYDLRGFVRRRIYGRNSDRVLKRKKALCGEYAELLNEMCASIGIPSETVVGYTLDYDHFAGDTLYRAEHAWSIVKANSEWQLIDLTYAGGYIMERRQWFRKLLWKYINVPYVPRFKYVHEFNSDWVDVPPAELIESHYPTLPMHQLLSPTVSINEFSLSLIPAAEIVELSSSAAIDGYHASDQLTKWKTQGFEGQKSNPANSRVAGINAFQIADSLYKKYYVPEGKVLDASDDELTELGSLHAFADSCLLESKRDNRREYTLHSERSKEWKSELRARNRKHRAAISNRRSENKRQVSQIKRIERKLKSAKRYAGRASKKTKASRIEKVPRPKSVERENLMLIDSLARRIAEKKLLENRLIAMRDSIMTVYPEEYQMNVSDVERENKQGHKTNTKSLRHALMRRKMMFPLIHANETWIEKRWFAESHEALNQINLELTDTLINALRYNLGLARDTVKAYHGCVKQQLADLKKTKRSAFTDRQEVSRYIQKVEEHHIALRRFRLLCKDYLHLNGRMKNTLQSMTGTFKSSKRILRRDDRLEVVRYNHYRTQKRFIQSAEDRRIAAYRSRLKEISFILNRTRAKGML